MFEKGIWLTTITPFDDNNKIDETSLKALIKFYLDSGVHGLSFGVLGEVNKLSFDEKNTVTKILVEETKQRIPVNVVCTEQGTERTLKSSQKAEFLGASSVMIAPPNNLSNDDDIYKHYEYIATHLDIPIVVQDDPVSTQTKISDSLLAKMANNLKNIQFVKLEDFPSIVKVSNVLDHTKKLKVIGGGARFFYEELNRGAVGTMSSFPFPEELVSIFNLYITGRKKEAKEKFYNILPLIRYEEILYPNVTDRAMVTKLILKYRGIIKNSNVRKPSAQIDELTKIEIKEIIKDIQLCL